MTSYHRSTIKFKLHVKAINLSKLRKTIVVLK